MKQYYLHKNNIVPNKNFLCFKINQYNNTVYFKVIKCFICTIDTLYIGYTSDVNNTVRSTTALYFEKYFTKTDKKMTKWLELLYE